MDAAGWVSVFQRIPPDKEDLLVIVTTSGVEIIINKIIRVEPEYLILKGRLSGAIDAARAVLMPYDQINNLAINKQILDADVLSVFGLEGPSEPAAAKPEPAAAEELPPASKVTPPPPTKPSATTIPSWAQTGSGSTLRPPSKSIFLERLRARLGTDSSKSDKS